MRVRLATMRFWSPAAVKLQRIACETAVGGCAEATYAKQPAIPVAPSRNSVWKLARLSRKFLEECPLLLRGGDIENASTRRK